MELKDATSEPKEKSLFDRLFFEVNRLLTYSFWLPTEKSTISFYFQKLDYFCETSKSFVITDEDSISELLADRTLHILVTTLLRYKNVRTNVDLSNFNDPPDLTCVGNRLAFEVAVFYKASESISYYNLKGIYGYKQEDFVQKFNFDGSLKYSASRNVGNFEEHFSQNFYFGNNKFQEGEDFIGFEVEASNLLQQLASTTKKKLQVISIVGMAGLGKTTLTNRLYNDPYVVSYFHTRGSHVLRMTDNMLAHVLKRALMDQRYLIVIDDIWSIYVWNELNICFPDDNNGSKIMLTTRLKDVALHAQSNGHPLCLRFLTEEESFDLFKRKVFKDGNFFGNLNLIGKRITRKCRGLPLAIVVIAGLLKNNFEVDSWAQIEESVSSYIISDYSQCMDTLALSYNHLPQHLRPCLLTFGAFPEDYDIPVRKLIWLWIAEGFISQDGTKRSLEDIAGDYLMDLVDRSLVVVGKKRSNGAIKTCRIHDLLRELCLRKADEENFSPDIYNYTKHSFSCPHSVVKPTPKSQFLLGTYILTTPYKCSCYSSELTESFFKDISVTWDTSKPIRVLDISSIDLPVFPGELLQLVHLTYLELRFRCGDPPESISHLKELQTLIMSSRRNMFIPRNMWKMISLKHLCIKSGEIFLEYSNVEEEPSLLENLQYMSLVSPNRPCQNILARTPNLQKLGLCGPLTTNSGDFKCPDLGLLMQLETLKLLNTISFREGVRLSISTIFPGSLKNLTLSNTCLYWKESWVFEMIPNLEVLKLKFNAFVGKDWETSPESFPRLKVLRLDELDFATWTASRIHFPVLENLQVYRCPYLMEIPEDFGNICTLEWIELSGCSDAATNSARDIQKEQERKCNDSLKILLNPGLTKPRHDRAET